MRVILGLFWDNGKQNGNYFLGFRVSGIGQYKGYGGVMFGENQMGLGKNPLVRIYRRAVLFAASLVKR